MQDCPIKLDLRSQRFLFGCWDWDGSPAGDAHHQLEINKRDILSDFIWSSNFLCSVIIYHYMTVFPLSPQECFLNCTAECIQLHTLDLENYEQLKVKTAEYCHWKKYSSVFGVYVFQVYVFYNASSLSAGKHFHHSFHTLGQKQKFIHELSFLECIYSCAHYYVPIIHRLSTIFSIKKED